ncbi:CFF_HP2_G0028270.mRNA.1.CDS.1 [Saccharomyces cerevisiae]|nr:CFF_HP2_G0028270.mRNA.1.CDS.1 [Saccharomyces cerevisiae]CAI6670630.1 CFF_HP1_G0029120.mRNA.1.CDS.1 [Saccharomyces cerevisiae]CAI6677816.1 CFF_HP2_G0028270.mRNA.1.CDS.1 [Saccharomyces cerevisiae]
MRIEKHRTPLSKGIIWTILSVCLLFMFTTLILVIVATAGSTANYKPLTNIYIGEADIKHINVSKVIPQIDPILTILGSALTAPNSSLDDIFGAMKNIADTPALTPLLTLLSNADNTTVTIESLTELAPLAISGNPASSTRQLTEINGLLKYSDNATETLDGLSRLVSASLSSASSNSSSDSTTLVLDLLKDSDNPQNSTDALLTLNNLTMSEKAQLLPVFRLFAFSTNQTATMTALATLMNTTISPSLAQTLLTQLQNTISNGGSLNNTFSTLQPLVPQASAPAFNAVELLLNQTTSTNQTLSTLSDLLEQNVTQSSSAKKAFAALTQLMENSDNSTMVVTSVQSLAAVTNTTQSTQQLIGLDDVISSSSNTNETLSILSELQSGLSGNSSSVQYIPYLFSLLGASSDPKTTFSSLVTLTSWAQENPQTFLPILDILADAKSVQPISAEELNAMTPNILEYLKIPIYYRLSIFTLCHANLENKILDCNSPHAVQNLDFRSIIYDALVTSDFQPYLNALNISANDLYLEGKLLHREHQYVPAVRSVLALNLLAIIFSFFTMIFIILLYFNRYMFKQPLWLIALALHVCVGVATVLAAIIISVMIAIIKSGTADDKYGVVFKAGPAYTGLIWTAFALSFIATGLIIYTWWRNRRSGRYMSGSVTNRKGENYTYGDGSAISADRFGDHNLGDDDDADFEKQVNRNEITAIDNSSSANNTDVTGSTSDRTELSHPDVTPKDSNGPVNNNAHLVA